MKMSQNLQEHKAISRLLSKKVKLILLISILALLALSCLFTSCSEDLAKTIDDETTTTTTSVINSTSSSIPISTTTTTTTKINTANYIAINKLNEPYSEQPCIVNLIFGLKDYAGNILPGIYDPLKYKLLEDDNPLAYAESFYRFKERSLFEVALKTVIMMDISLSVGNENIVKLKNSVKSIINNKSDNQEIAIYTFSGTVTLVKDFTLDKTVLNSAVDGITLGGASTNLYGAIYDGLDKFSNTIVNKLVTNTFMIVLTDGVDTSSVRTLDEVITKRGDKSVITVGIGSDVDSEVLRNLGNFGSFMATNFDTLQTYIDSMRTFIAETYNNLCWLTYFSPKRSGTHTIELSLCDNTNTGPTSKISGSFSASSTQFYDVAPGIYVNDSYIYPEGSSEIVFGDTNTEKTIRINSYFGAKEPVYTIKISDAQSYAIAEVTTDAKKTFNLTRLNGGNVTVTIDDTANNYTKVINITGIKIVTAAFDSGGGSAVGTQSGMPGFYASEPPAPTKTGYTFAGWYKESTLTNAWNFSVDTVAVDTIIYAKWTPNRYTVTFNSNGGSSVFQQLLYFHQRVTQPTAVKSGYTLVGWYKESTLTNAWDFGAEPVTANTTLYAKWTGITHTVTLDKQSGSGGTNSVTAIYGSNMPNATAPTRTGYKFGGYWDATTGGTQYYTAAMTSARAWNKAVNTTLYARWTINQYTVTFNSNGGGSINQQTIDYGGLVSQPVIPTKTDYIFSGWYKESTFTNLWNLGIEAITTDITLYAKWMFDYHPTLWAKSVIAGRTGSSRFKSVAVDASGNIYAAGVGKGSSTYSAGVSVVGTGALLVKYDSSGTALWAKSVTAGTESSYFNSVAVDSSENIYAVGYQSGTGSFTYGDGVSVAGTYSGTNVVLVKYDYSGTALWAKSVTEGTNVSWFNSVAVDADGNIYAAGYQFGTGSCTYGTGVSVAGTDTNANIVLVKYDSTGTALWAKSVTAGTGSSSFKSVAVDSSGNIYAVGSQSGTGSCTYGTGVSVAGTDTNANIVLVKYDSTGTALWARSVTTGTNNSEFNSVGVDALGNIYAAGYQHGTGSYTYGEGVSVAGTGSFYNVVLVKYDSSGTALWVKSVTEGTILTNFNSVAVDSTGNVYAAGYQRGTGSITYGEGVSVAGTYSLDNNVVLVKYNTSGAALWAKSITAGTDYSEFNSVGVDVLGNIYATGSQRGTGSYTYGTGVSVAGTGSSSNVVLVKYSAAP